MDFISLQKYKALKHLHDTLESSLHSRARGKLVTGKTLGSNE
jgi:hypothetical protein